MSGSPILELVVGIGFVYSTYSIVSGSIKVIVPANQANKGLDAAAMKQHPATIAFRILTIKSANALFANAIPPGCNYHVIYTVGNTFSDQAVRMARMFPFDLLNKISNIRSAGVKPASSGK